MSDDVLLRKCDDCVKVNVCLICVGVEKMLADAQYLEDNDPIDSNRLAVICNEYKAKEGS